MQIHYWKDRWNKGDTGWHQTEVEPNLIQHFNELEPTRVFVPLCGKSLDLKWLVEQGHFVIGVEASELAVEQFFAEHHIPFQRELKGGLTLYKGEKIEIYCGDFFALTPQLLGTVGAVYDRAALIALPQQIRTSYAIKMTDLLSESLKQSPFLFLQILLQRNPHDENGPPHSIQTTELEQLYRGVFHCKLLSRELVDTLPSGTRVEECVFRLIKN